MKPWQSLPGLLKLAIGIEVAAFLLVQFAESESLVRRTGSAFDYFWAGLWYLLAAYWLVAWIALLGRWKWSFEIYAAGWLMAFGYTFLSGPVIDGPWAGLLDGVTTLSGGAVLVLAWLRKLGIGDWSPSLESLPELPVTGGDPAA